MHCIGLHEVTLKLYYIAKTIEDFFVDISIYFTDGNAGDSQNIYMLHFTC